MAKTSEPWFRPGMPLRPQRVSLTAPVRYRAISEERWHTGRTENISPAGVVIRASRLFPPDTAVEAVLTLPPGVLPHLTGQVLFAGVVARILRPRWSGEVPAFAIAFERYELVATSPVPGEDPTDLT